MPAEQSLQVMAILDGIYRSQEMAARSVSKTKSIVVWAGAWIPPDTAGFPTHAYA